jgi:uncharacterized membrane protein SpoIIM required for sporulation
MKEIDFLRKNSGKWQKFEQLLANPSRVQRDELAELYLEMTDDLSFARTYYPGGKTAKYLNELSAKVHREIYKNKRDDTRSIKKFWFEKIPEAVFESRREIIISLAIFLVSIAIGAFSAANDQTFVRYIMGDNYVNMTINNIENGDPLAVYKSQSQTEMFLGITWNNIWVSFNAYIFGLIFSLGTGWILLQNGIMLGCFQYFFTEYDLLWESFRVVYIHGTLELSAIVIAGGAGITLGNSFMFPGTYSRMESFRRGAGRSIRVLISLIPVFTVAGFLEGFVTRHTEMPLFMSLLIIFSSLFFISWYYFYLPYKLFGSNNGTGIR